MWFKWLPWEFIVRRLARSHGFLDPIAVLTYLRRFAQPSEVAEPIELLRAGMVMQARGLMNSRAIQQNIDWVWPYWVRRQFDPRDRAFIPRAFSLTQINLTHRNWTAIGIPDVRELPIVDPRGLVTPFLDGWSLDGWIVAENGKRLIPSALDQVEQRQHLNGRLAVRTTGRSDGLQLDMKAQVEMRDNRPCCTIYYEGRADSAAWLVVSLRPYNPEGIRFTHRIKLSADRRSWLVDDDRRVWFNEPIERNNFSDYHEGDVSFQLPFERIQTSVTCGVGMVTAAAMFRLDNAEPRGVEACVPLLTEKSQDLMKPAKAIFTPAESIWLNELKDHCQLEIPDTLIKSLYDSAIRTLILHAPGDVYPGPFTYKRFWFRDAAYILNALLGANLHARVERVLDTYPARQTPLGYFHSQEGEWDSNGEALWIFDRYCQLTGQRIKGGWHTAVLRGAKWIGRKRIKNAAGKPHNGLLPAGFSAEHLGLNDYYYWDDFWSLAGLESAARLLRDIEDSQAARAFEEQAADLRDAIERSLQATAERLDRPAMPASPYRRLDAGAIGSVAAGYPLKLFPADDPRLLDTVEWLMGNCFVRGGFFQEMSHSGINPYLTLHLAQVLLRAGDPRYFDLMQTIAGLASPTGQWPEAIHPQTGGGCMGDGQHVWAAAEWVLMIRSLFVLEELDPPKLILCAGIPDKWLEVPGTISFGPTPTPWGPISVIIKISEELVSVDWYSEWRGAVPNVVIRLDGYKIIRAEPDVSSVQLSREGV